MVFTRFTCVLVAVGRADNDIKDFSNTPIVSCEIYVSYTTGFKYRRE